jgi:hypothetical protein
VNDTSNPASTVSSEPGHEDPLIWFQVEGGFANQIRTITIGTGGAARIEVSGRPAERRLAPETVRAIVAELDGSGLFDRDRTYPATGADLQRFEIRYAGATVIAYDTSLPAELRAAVRLLEAAIRG